MDRHRTRLVRHAATSFTPRVLVFVPTVGLLLGPHLAFHRLGCVPSTLSDAHLAFVRFVHDGWIIVPRKTPRASSYSHTNATTNSSRPSTPWRVVDTLLGASGTKTRCIWCHGKDAGEEGGSGGEEKRVHLGVTLGASGLGGAYGWIQGNQPFLNKWEDTCME